MHHGCQVLGHQEVCSTVLRKIQHPWSHRSAEEPALNDGALVSWALWCLAQLLCDLVTGEGGWCYLPLYVCFHLLLLLNQGKLQGIKPEPRREKERWPPHTLCPPLDEACLALGSVLTEGSSGKRGARAAASIWSTVGTQECSRKFSLTTSLSSFSFVQQQAMNLFLSFLLFLPPFHLFSLKRKNSHDYSL